jgi:Na+/phosphate symporter
VGWIIGLNIGGLVFNLVGAIFLFISIKSSHYATEINSETKKEIPIALLDKNIAKTGLGFIFLGFLLQLISVCLSLGG